MLWIHDGGMRAAGAGHHGALGGHVGQSVQPNDGASAPGAARGAHHLPVMGTASATDLPGLSTMYRHWQAQMWALGLQQQQACHASFPFLPGSVPLVPGAPFASRTPMSPPSARQQPRAKHSAAQSGPARARTHGRAPARDFAPHSEASSRQERGDLSSSPEESSDCVDRDTADQMLVIPSDSATEWLRRNLVADDEMCIAKAVMFSAYLDDVRARGETPVGLSSFSRSVQLLFPNVTTRRLGSRGSTQRHFCGVAKAPTSDCDLPCVRGTRKRFSRCRTSLPPPGAASKPRPKTARRPANRTSSVPHHAPKPHESTPTVLSQPTEQSVLPEGLSLIANLSSEVLKEEE